jgi:hypothetical protein
MANLTVIKKGHLRFSHKRPLSGGGGNRTLKWIRRNQQSPSAFVICEECRAALALHSECFKRQLLASLDADLLAVIARWDSLPGAIRKAMMDLLEST